MRSARLLVHAAGPAWPAKRESVVLVAPYYGNHRLLPAFLDHHRRIGVGLFVFLDLSVNGELPNQLSAAPDCAIWRPRGRLVRSKALCWLNYLRWRYGTGRWCLSVEPSELFIFAHSECRRIQDLIEFIEGERRGHVYALAIEMYGNDSRADLTLDAGEHPLAKLPCFDSVGYASFPGGRYRNVLVRGGLQRRTLFADGPMAAPALNRIALVKWRWFYAYLTGTRLLSLPRLNTPHCPWHSSPTACLLRFALLDDELSLEAAVEAEAGELISDGGGPSYPGLAQLRGRKLQNEITARFTSSADLVESGLVNSGQWF